MTAETLLRRRSAACLLALALAAVPTLGTATPLDCPVRPLAVAGDLVLPEWFEEELQEEEVALALPDPASSAFTPGGYSSDVKAGTVAPIGVEIVELPGCPDISDR
ncbi:hypothetical protein ACFPOI_27855 [Nonomuraea angiospora]|uniref:Uncharacterized protein n=1 Tax=Nonomuraea angiospora TaxID=46172 RepID=A0ABR9LN48_9ACTN|nr:hypothetical protein [Nonomuraea angiospora]MBE1582079.1 hypothetical protein [Nonomuraea angiospora]